MAVILHSPKPAGLSTLNREQAWSLYLSVRFQSESICQSLATEDYVIQSMDDVSPPKWHLAHTSWFFENFLLTPFLRGYPLFHPRFGYLFNSYYESVGEFYPRRQRGFLSRPTVEEIYDYRTHVNHFIARLIQTADDAQWQELAFLLTLGMHHEHQHQELMLTDIKHIFATNPLRPAYQPPRLPAADRPEPALEWLHFPAGLRQIGHHGTGFAFDNESPRHEVHLGAYRLGSRLVTNGEYLEFMEDGGYAKPQHWLSDGWRTVRERAWRAPLYWEHSGGRWWQMTLSGMRRLVESEPVCHISYYEADAYARWAGKRLPTEAEWESAAMDLPVAGNLMDSGILHPTPAPETTIAPTQFFGDVWEWTCSPYVPYPGYRPAQGALGEYNGKFMCNQMVLRGGSCVTPATHIRPSYRNFFPPDTRWQFTGLRLAEDA
ncbi:MAG: ergothioneine biosynthesis protein EgtB [Pseudomonadota bacterium]